MIQVMNMMNLVNLVKVLMFLIINVILGLWICVIRSRYGYIALYYLVGLWYDLQYYGSMNKKTMC